MKRQKPKPVVPACRVQALRVPLRAAFRDEERPETALPPEFRRLLAAIRQGRQGTGRP